MPLFCLLTFSSPSFSRFIKLTDKFLQNDFVTLYLRPPYWIPTFYSSNNDVIVFSINTKWHYIETDKQVSE